MSDMFRVTAPIVNNNIVQPSREQLSAESSPLEMAETPRAAAAKAYSELNPSNNVSGGENDRMTPEVLGNMLKDPNVTVNFIKNIAALQEIIGDISAQGLPDSEELEKLLNEFLLAPENLAQELIDQEQLSTAFRGNLFDSLRQLLKECPDPRIRTAVANFLKAINNENTKPEILKTLSENLKYLSDILSSDKGLSEKLHSLSEKFASNDAENNFSQLMNETKELLRDISRNTAPDGKLDDLCSMIKYNLSRYNANSDVVGKAIRNIMQFMPEREVRTEFLQKLFEHLSGFENRSFDSKILDAMFKFFQNNDDQAQIENLNAEKSMDMFLESCTPEEAEEFQQAFKELTVKSESFADEFLNTQQNTGEYKGKIFDTLKELLKNNSDPELKNAVKSFLKAVYIENSKPEMLNSFSEKMSHITEFVLQEDNPSGENILENTENGILENAAKNIIKFLDDSEKTEFMEAVGKFISEADTENPDVKIFDAIVRVFQNQADKENALTTNGEKTEAAVYSAVSSEDPAAAEQLEQAFEQLAEKSENAADEFLNTDKSSSVFKGEIFEELKELVKESNDPELKKAVLNLLKAVNIENNKPEILKSFSDTMTEISEKLTQNKGLSADIQNMNDKNGLSETLKNVLKFIPDDKIKTNFLQKFYNEALNFESENKNSKVLDNLVKILQKQTDSESIMQMKGENIESVIRSLLSSPGNFTPLLHFVLPVDDGLFNIFGEMWINPDEEEKKTEKDSKSGGVDDERMMHMLIVFDIPDVGRFETELWVKGKKINMSLLCPPAMENYTDSLSSDLKKSISFSEYFFDEIKVGKLEKNRSLIEVFPVLPQKRNGINVRI